MDPAWVQIGIGIGSGVLASAVTGAIWYGTLKAWMAVREEREGSVRKDVDDLESRMRIVERDLPPLDYPRR